MSTLRRYIDTHAKHARPLEALARDALAYLGVTDEAKIRQAVALAEAAIQHEQGIETAFTATFVERGIRDLNDVIATIGADYGAPVEAIETFASAVQSVADVRGGTPVEIAAAEAAYELEAAGIDLPADATPQPQPGARQDVPHLADSDEDPQVEAIKRDLRIREEMIRESKGQIDVDHLTPAARRYLTEGGALTTDTRGAATFVFRDGSTTAPPANRTLTSSATLPGAQRHDEPSHLEAQP